MIIPTIVPIHPDEHIVGWIERLAEANNMNTDTLLSHYFDISDEVYSKQDGSLKSVGGLSRIADADIGISLRDIIVKHTAAADAVFMNPFSSAVYLGAVCTGLSIEKSNKVLDTAKRKYCPVCVQDDKKDHGQALMHAPHQSTAVNTCWKHGVCLVQSTSDQALVTSSEQDTKTALFMHEIYAHGIIADVRAVRRTVLSDKYMRKMKTLMESGQMDEILQYADIKSLTDFFKYLLAPSNQNGANRIKLARAIAQFVDIEDLEKSAPEPAKTKTECDLILRAENKGSRIVSYDFPMVTIRCGRCGDVYTAWYQSVTSGLLCPHCTRFTLQSDASEEMFKVFAQRYGFKLSGERDKKRVEIAHICGKKLWIDPVTALSQGEMTCPACGTPENAYGNSKNIVLALQRTGQRKMMSCGMAAEIIAYRRAKDIDLEFEDGTVRNTSYERFETGDVLPVDKQQYVHDSHIGEIVEMHCGQTAAVIAYYSGHRVDIQFDDGHIRYNVPYESFAQGNVSPISVSELGAMRVGQSQQMRNGAVATIIEYRNYQDIDVRFDNEEIREHVSCSEFDRGNLRPGAASRWIGQKAVMHCGKEAEVTDYRNCDDIDVMFDDGSKICHVTTKRFARRTLRPPGEDWRGRLSQEKANEYIGERKMMHCGQEATIIAYRNSEDIDIQFEDGLVRTGITMREYKKGSAAPVHRHRYAEIRIGETKMMSCGLEAVITAYRSARDMDIRFSDGTVKLACDYNRFKRCELAPVRQDRIRRDRKGEKAVMRCGLEAEIIEYRRSDDMDVRFSDGSLLQGVQYHNFKSRTLRSCMASSIERIGEKKVMNCGIEAEVIAYRNANDIDLRFSDGRVRKNAAYHNFKNGRVSPPDQSEL